MTALVDLTVRIERVLMKLSMLFMERLGLAWKALKDVGAVMGETIPGPGPSSIYTRRISWVPEELQEVDHLGKQPFVPKAIFTLVARIINQKILSR